MQATLLNRPGLIGAVLNVKISAPESLTTGEDNRNVWTLGIVPEIPGTISPAMISFLSFVRKQKWGSRIRIKVLSGPASHVEQMFDILKSYKKSTFNVVRIVISTNFQL